MKEVIILLLGIIILVVVGLTLDLETKISFCKDNPEVNRISSSDYTKYGNWFVKGNNQINMSEEINCEQILYNNRWFI